MNDNDKIVNELVEQLDWWEHIGRIASIDKDAIDNLIFRVMMAL